MASEIRVNQIQNRSGLTTTTLNDQGVVVAGIVTANSFSGDLTGNVTGNISGATATFTGNIDMKTGGSGNLFLGDDQLLRFGDSNELTIQHSSPGPGNFIEGDSAGKNLFIRSKLNQEQLKLVPDGQVEAYFAGSKKFETTGSGTITTGIITAIGGNLTEGSFLTGTSVGVGTTTTAGRNAGVGTANGTLIYNSTDNALEMYVNNEWSVIQQKVPFNVSGGTISNDVNRSNFVTHTFTSPGNFVSAGQITSAEIFVIGGGGGGGARAYGAGGGAGGAMLATGVTLDPGTYGVSIGSGGGGGAYPGGARGSDGGNTIFNPGGGQQRQGTGGGGGGGYDSNSTGRDGGSGGGGSSRPNSPGGSSTQPSAPGSGTDYGNRGGNYGNHPNGWAPAGGGGAGAQGTDTPAQINGGGNGGAGVQLSISGTATYYGGGGGGAIYNTIAPGVPNAAPADHKSFGGAGGGGTAGTHPSATIPPLASPNQNATANTGSGGAGAHTQTQNFSTGAGGNGGSGLVIIAYPSIDNSVLT